MNPNTLFFPVEFSNPIKAIAQASDLLSVEFDWNIAGPTRTNKHTAIVFLNPTKVISLIDADKVKFFDIGRMISVINGIQSSEFWIPPIKFESTAHNQDIFKLTNGCHRTILMSRSNIDSVPYITCDRMVEKLLQRFGSGNINKNFDLSSLNYPIYF